MISKVSITYNRNGIISRIMIYIILMMIGVLFRTYITHDVTIVWIVNLIGLSTLFFHYIRFCSKVTGYGIITYILLGFFTVCINSSYLGNLKSYGTNVNIFVLPVIWLFIEYIFHHERIDESEVENLFNFLSALGLISFIFAWITGYTDIIRVFQGSMNAYRARAYGFFYHKNIYGAFVSLTIAADLYLYTQKKSKYRLVLITMKIIAVIISLSRAALLQMIVMMFTFFWVNRKRSIREWLALLFILIILVIVYYNTPQIQSYMHRSVLRLDVGDAGRRRLTQRALSLFGENFGNYFFGVGYSGLTSMDIDIDNTYLYLVFTGGIAKVLYFVFFVCLSLKRIHTFRLYYNKELGDMFLSVLVSYLVFAFFESVEILELGLLNFMYTLYLLVLPSFSYTTNVDKCVN